MVETGQILEMLVYYRTPVYSADANVGRLIEAVDSALLFDVAREALSVLKPRKQFATDVGVTVGSVRATKNGQTFLGRREMVNGLERLRELRRDGRLGNYSRHYFGPPVWVDAGFDLARPAYGKTAAYELTTVSAHVSIKVDAVREWIAALSDAMFEFFVLVSTIGAPLTARCSWWSRGWNLEFERLTGMWEKHTLGQPTVPGYRTMLYLPPAAVIELGGAAAVSTNAPVADARRIDHVDGSIGMAALLCRTPEELTVERLQEWRNYLEPVLDLPEERYRPASWADRHPDGWLAGKQRPLDILATDFQGL